MMKLKVKNVTGLFLFWGGGWNAGSEKRYEILTLARDQRMNQTAVANFFQTREKEITENKLF